MTNPRDISLPVNDEDFVQPQRRGQKRHEPQAAKPKTDAKVLAEQGGYNPRSTPQEETVHGRAAAEANRCKIKG